MEKKLHYCSQQQKNTLVDLLKSTEYEILLSGKFPPHFSFKDAQKKWEEIAALLNSIPGSKKDWKQWRKSWQDIRSKTKKRKVDQVKYSAGTGGGPSYPDQLTDTDEKILSTMSVVEILGNQDVNETEINFEYENESTPSFNIEYDTDIPLEIHELQAIQPNVEESHIDIPKDHIYCTKTNSQIPVTKGSNKENEAKKKRTVASQRLKDSTIASKALVEIAKEKLEIKKEYYIKKLCILERQVSAIENLAEILKRKPE